MLNFQTLEYVNEKWKITNKEEKMRKCEYLNITSMWKKSCRIKNNNYTDNQLQYLNNYINNF